MRIRAAFATAGLLAGVIGFTASPALADGINVDPSTASRGSEVTVTGFGCAGGVTTPDTGVQLTGRTISTAHGSVTDGRFSLTTKVRWDAPLGRSTLTGVCQPSGSKLTGTIRVQPGHRRPDHDDDGRWPHRWPHTGGGGMAAAAGRDDTPLLSSLSSATLAGIGLLAGAAAIGAITLVRSRRSRGDS